MKEIIIDTNILARYFLKDIPQQAQQAKKYIDKILQEKIVGCISILVIDELIWALENYYTFKKTLFIPFLIQLLVLPNIRIIEVDKYLIIALLRQMQTIHIDFTDLYLLSIAGRRAIVSFDKKLKRLEKAKN